MGPDSRTNPRSAYAFYASAVRQRVESAVADSLGGGLARERSLGTDVAAVVDALHSLGTRGGKRMRAVLVGLGYDGVGGERGLDAVLGAALAMELVQVYLLAHDDWMDGDLVRRGGPSVHKMLQDAFGSEALGDVTGILAGDFASALAQEAFFTVDVPAEHKLRAARRFAHMQHEVVLGQIMDVCAERRPLDGLALADVEAMHAKKTGAYTVGGPLAVGALLGGADDARERAIDAFATPLGVAFQLRDDVLGTFGDTAATGKPRFGDLRQGKRTSLVAAFVAARGARGVEALRPVLGQASASDADCEAVAREMHESGARARIEARVSELLTEARSRLGALAFTPEAALVLEGAIDALGERSS